MLKGFRNLKTTVPIFQDNFEKHASKLSIDKIKDMSFSQLMELNEDLAYQRPGEMAYTHRQRLLRDDVNRRSEAIFGQARSGQPNPITKPPPCGRARHREYRAYQGAGRLSRYPTR